MRRAIPEAIKPYKEALSPVPANSDHPPPVPVEFEELDELDELEDDPPPLELEPPPEDPPLDLQLYALFFARY